MEHDRQAGPPGSAGPNWALLAFAVAAGALAVALLSWYQSRAAIDELRAGQRGLQADLAALNRAPVIDLAGAPALGSADARVALVEFSDYECPFCIRHFQQTMPQLLANYINAGKIRYAFRDWPVDALHPEAVRAHQAAHCADDQGRFWVVHPRLFGPPGTHGRESLLGLGRDAGLDMTTFAACLSSGKFDAAIRATGQMAVDFGATGTPAFFIGLFDKAEDKVTVLHGLTGAQDYSVFAEALDAILLRAG
jgi:protein-disulfide isomerase